MKLYLIALLILLLGSELPSQTYEASTSERANLGPQAAFDGDESTRWSAKFSERQGWIQVSYPEKQTFDRVTLFSGIRDLKGAPKDFEIHAGDGAKLSLVKAVQGITADRNETIFPRTTATTFRVVVKALVNEAWSPTISEIRFGLGAEAPKSDAAPTVIVTNASDEGIAGHGPDMAFDGRDDTWFESSVKGKEVWIERSFPDPVGFDAVSFVVDTESGYGVPKSFILRVKTTSGWSTVTEETESFTTNYRARFKPQKSKTWRFVVRATIDEDGPVRLNEVKLLTLGTEEWPESTVQNVPQKEINAAIDRGAAWLRAERKDDGNWATSHTKEYPMGVMALVGLALKKSGVAADDPLHADLLDRLAKMPFDRTYSVAIYAMYLRSLSKVKHIDKLQACADYLVEKQAPDGLWGYPEGRSDLSNAQYALLGLRAAGEAGIKVPEKTWRKSWEWLERNQKKSGGFNYVPHGDGAKDPPTGSMTAAALAAANICQQYLAGDKALETRNAQIAEAAWRWLDERFSVALNPASHRSHYYWLYGLERIGSFYDRRQVGEQGWYQAGARHLVRFQYRNGSWHNSIEDTCFALLFLNRASLSTE